MLHKRFSELLQRNFTNYDFPNIDSILRRFTNCFFKAMAKQGSDKIRVEQDKRNTEKENFV